LSPSHSRTQHIYRCDCHTHHYLTFSWYPEDQRDRTLNLEAYVEVGGDFRSTWKEKIKVAWRVLRGLDSCYAEVILDEFSSVDLRNALNDFIIETNRKRGGNVVYRPAQGEDGAADAPTGPIFPPGTEYRPDQGTGDPA
jgi:hypothetical protein